MLAAAPMAAAAAAGAAVNAAAAATAAAAAASAGAEARADPGAAAAQAQAQLLAARQSLAVALQAAHVVCADTCAAVLSWEELGAALRGGDAASGVGEGFGAGPGNALRREGPGGFLAAAGMPEDVLDSAVLPRMRRAAADAVRGAFAAPLAGGAGGGGGAGVEEDAAAAATAAAAAAPASTSSFAFAALSPRAGAGGRRCFELFGGRRAGAEIAPPLLSSPAHARHFALSLFRPDAPRSAGVDFALDEDLRPWLLSFSENPALGALER